ncbi:hypothetical protein [Pontibacter ramchanderi]|uniref:Uncharacterized protein n=1 Tax=Pontibacter ramchanderi TaxID=1179743 RepID=A0A2N3U6N3_9BACT|nr:hypothetical protein [Pontibacter ramchanderi]PKV62403.1 hypothetical protein BD749_3887 [Pontibacter ramchanderi]
MKFLFFTCVFVMLMALGCKAQSYTMEDLKKFIEAKYSIKPDTLDICPNLIIDGIPYETADIVNGKKQLTSKDLKLFKLIEQEVLFHHKVCDWILLLGSEVTQKHKEKKELLNSLKANLNAHVPELIIRDFKCDSCMAVVVNGKLLGELESKQFLSRLKVNKVEYISFYEAANPDYYGYRAKNGLMEIYLKE